MTNSSFNLERTYKKNNNEEVRKDKKRDKFTDREKNKRLRIDKLKERELKIED